MATNGTPQPSSRPVLAYLGPQGTYSAQCAYERFPPSQCEIDFAPCKTIADVYNYRPSVPRPTLHLIPFENSKNGPVMETLDLLLQASPRPDLRVVEECRTRVQHCLVGVEGDDGEDLEGVMWVRSHEQALNQCQSFLSTYLPNAKRIPVTSTALGALLLLPQPDGSRPTDDKGLPITGRGAAVCSKVVVETYEGLRVLRGGIEDQKGNRTRFLLLSSTPGSALPCCRPSPPPSLPPPPFHALVAFPANQPLHETLLAVGGITSPASPSGTKLLTLDRRPTPEQRTRGQTDDEEDGGGFRTRYIGVFEVPREEAVHELDAVGAVLGSWRAYVAVDEREREIGGAVAC